jgi:hypothetical protein
MATRGVTASARCPEIGNPSAIPITAKNKTNMLCVTIEREACECRRALRFEIL